MQNVVIIDDEAPAREIVREYLNSFPELKVVCECSDGFSGLKAIQELKPDLVFLDVQMPKLSGFELLEVLDERPAVIFTTAYDQYAIQAFEQNAVDYLLKPFSETRFRQAVEKAMQRLEAGNHEKPLEGLDKQLTRQDEIVYRVVVKSRNEIRMIPVEQIYYIEAQDDYVMIYLETERFMKQKTLKYFEDHLNPMDFIRIHRSFIVHADKIKKIESYEKSGGIAILRNGKQIPVSRSGYSRLRRFLNE